MAHVMSFQSLYIISLPTPDTGRKEYSHSPFYVLLRRRNSGPTTGARGKNVFWTPIFRFVIAGPAAHSDQGPAKGRDYRVQRRMAWAAPARGYIPMGERLRLVTCYINS